MHGLDTMSEVALQTVLQNGLAHFYAVTRAVHYPSSSGAKRSSRQRCDLVLSPLGTPLLPESNEQLSLHLSDAASAPRKYASEASFWLEVKVAYQLRAGGLQHKGYSGQFRQAVVADLRKLTADPLIRHAALLLIVFTESAEIACQDLELFKTLFFSNRSCPDRARCAACASRIASATACVPPPCGRSARSGARLARAARRFGRTEL